MSAKSLFSQVAPFPNEHPWNYLWRQAAANALVFPTIVFMKRGDRINPSKEIPARNGRVYKLKDFSELVPLHQQQVTLWWKNLRTKQENDTLNLVGLKKNICPLCLERSLALEVFGFTALGICIEHSCQLVSACECCKTQLEWLEGGHYFCQCGFDLRKSAVQFVPQKLLEVFQEASKNKRNFQNVMVLLYENIEGLSRLAPPEEPQSNPIAKVEQAISLFDDFNGDTKRVLLELLKIDKTALETRRILFFEPNRAGNSCEHLTDGMPFQNLIYHVTRILKSLITYRNAIVTRCSWTWLRIEFLPSKSGQSPLKVPLWAEEKNKHHHSFSSWMDLQIEKSEFQGLLKDSSSHFCLFLHVAYLDADWLAANKLQIPEGFEL